MPQSPNYVRSTDGADSDSGATWALANATVAGAVTDMTSGGRTFVSQAHNETTAGVVVVNLNGTLAAPHVFACVNDAAEPPTAFATGAVITATGANGIGINGNGLVRGFVFNVGTGAGPASSGMNQNNQNSMTIEACDFVMGNSHPSSTHQIGGAAGGVTSKTLVQDCRYKFTQSGQRISAFGVPTLRRISFIAGTVTPTDVFGIGAVSNPTQMVVEDSDFTNLSTIFNVFGGSGTAQALGIIRNCILPNGWTGALCGTALANPGFRLEMYNCAAGSTKYLKWVMDTYATERESTTVYRTGGAVWGTAPVSVKLSTTSQPCFPSSRFESNMITRSYPGTTAEDAAFVAGASKTIELEFVHDTSAAAGQGSGTGFAFKNDEFALEVQTFDILGNVLTTTRSTAPVDIFAAPTDLPSSSAAWTTTGLTTVVKQKFSVTVAPQEKGTIVARVIGFKPSKVIYYDPKLTVV